MDIWEMEIYEKVTLKLKCMGPKRVKLLGSL